MCPTSVSNDSADTEHPSWAPPDHPNSLLSAAQDCWGAELIQPAHPATSKLHPAASGVQTQLLAASEALTPQFPLSHSFPLVFCTFAPSYISFVLAYYAPL